MDDWAKLPYDIIHKVASYLEAIEDFFAFSAVCRSWQSVYLAKQWCPGPQIPWIMLSHNEQSTVTSFFSLYRNKVCTSELPETSGRWCLGTSSEWLLTRGSHLQMNLLNVFTRVTKSLPRGSSLEVSFGGMMNRYQFIEKALVIKKPCTSTDTEELLVMVILGPLKQLAFCRPGYSSWVSVKAMNNTRVLDVAYVKNQIFALCGVGDLTTIDINGSNSPKVEYVSSSNNCWAWQQLFLVESSRDLWLVHQSYARKSSRKSLCFFVYCFDISQRQWSQLHNLGNQTIFLGDNSTISIRAPDHLKCKSNSIYFAIDKTDYYSTYRSPECNLGVYDMTIGFAQRFCNDQDLPKCFYLYWVMPALG